MIENSSNIKKMVYSHILNIGGLLQEELNKPNLEFGFRFLYPNKNGRAVIAAKQANKNFIEISLGTTLSPEHKDSFNKLPEPDKKSFIKNLQKILFRSELDYSYNFSQHYTTVVMDKIFIEKDNISVNDFFHSVRKIHSCTMNLIFYIQEFFSIDFNPIDFTLK